MEDADYIIEAVQSITSTIQKHYQTAAKQALESNSKKWTGLDNDQKADVLKKGRAEILRISGIFDKVSKTINETPGIELSPREIQEEINKEREEEKRLESLLDKLRNTN